MFHSHFHSYSSASWHTLSPSILVTPDVGPPWPLCSRRLRSPRRSSRTQTHALLDHNSTSLGPKQLARPRLHLVPSNSLDHEFTWPRATRSATTSTSPGHEQLARPYHLFSRPRASRQLTQPPLRDRSASTTSPASSSINNPPDLPLSTSSNSLSLRFSLQLQTQSDTATIPRVRS